jgi:hypothetical protein
MYFSIFHRLPLVGGHTGYPPWQYRAIDHEIRRLPDPAAIRALRDLTGLRYVVVRGHRLGEAELRQWREAASAGPGVRLVAAAGTDLLLEVTVAARRPWASYLAEGRRDSSRTALGTPLAPLDASRARGAVVGPVEMAVRAGRRARLVARADNRGMQDWPALLAPGADERHSVRISLVGRAVDGSSRMDESSMPLPRDVAAGDAVTFAVDVPGFATPGTYLLDMRIVQVGDPPLPGIRPWRTRVVVR